MFHTPASLSLIRIGEMASFSLIQAMDIILVNLQCGGTVKNRGKED